MIRHSHNSSISLLQVLAAITTDSPLLPQTGDLPKPSYSGVVVTHTTPFNPVNC